MRGRPLKISWQEDAEQLGQLYRYERDAELRPRLHALWLLRQGQYLRRVRLLLCLGCITSLLNSGSLGIVRVVSARCAGTSEAIPKGALVD